MKKNPIEVIVETTEFPSTGIAKANDKTYKIKNTLPGEKLKIIPGRARKNHIEAKILEHLSPSFLESKNHCPHRPECGGCLYDALPYEIELKHKEEELRTLFSRYPFYEGLKQVSSHKYYRNKMEFTFGNLTKDGILTLGQHSRGMFHNIIPVSNCSTCDKDFLIIRDFTEKFFRDKNIPFYHRKNNTGSLRHLVIRKSFYSGEILLILSHTSEMGLPLKEWIDGLLRLEITGKITSIFEVINDDVGDAVKGDLNLLFGNSEITEKISGLKFHISPFSFFQTNSVGAENLYKTALSLISDIENKTVFDLYSGTGTIASIVSLKAKKVVAIELVEEAVLEAKKSAIENGITNIDFLAGDVFKMLDETAETPDIIIVDPPREGLVEKSLKKIASYKVPEILYISCNPVNLKRDLLLFEDEGYEIKNLISLDMFPRTPNAETVALICKAK